MRLGLYSQIARQAVVAARQFIAERRYPPTSDGIRRCRQDLMDSEEPFDKVIKSSDFFSTSECRDLLFHVQEHRFTVPQVKDALQRAGLNFIGFSVGPRVVKEFAARFPDDTARTNLDNWHRLEREFPDMFAGMYDFWAQKPQRYLKREPRSTVHRRSDGRGCRVDSRLKGAYARILGAYARIACICTGPSPDACCPCSCTNLLSLHLRPPAACNARADAALRRPDGAVGPARHPVLAAAHARARGHVPDVGARRGAAARPHARCRARSIRWWSAGFVAIVAGRDARTREISLTRAGEKALRAAESYWLRAQAQVARSPRRRKDRRARRNAARIGSVASRSRRPRPLTRTNSETSVPHTSARADWRTPTVVLVCGGLVLTLSMGVRHGFGLFLQPMSADLHWGRETFALAMAVQNLMWGLMQPVSGMLADRFGTAKIVLAGHRALRRWPRHHGPRDDAAGARPFLRSYLIGTGLSGLTFSVISGVLGRAYPPEKRSMALGISAAAGSFGQFALLPADADVHLASRLVWRADRVGRDRRADGTACGRARREARHDAHAFAQSAAQALARGDRAPGLHAADDRILRLRLPGRVRRRPPCPPISPTRAFRPASPSRR